MMTRKQYIVLAQALAESKPIGPSDLKLMHLGAQKQWLRDVKAVAEALTHLNSNFDSAKFLRECGVPENTPLP